MFDAAEIARALTGAWLLFLDRPDAMRFFDLSERGFWRSFGAILLVVPGYALAALAELKVELGDTVADAGFSTAVFAVHKGLALALDWISLPIVLALLAGPLGFSRTYAAFIVARNWGAVIAVVPFGLVSLLFVLGIVDAETATFLSLAVLVVMLRYTFIIARRALAASVGFAVAIVVLDFAISLLIASGIDFFTLAQ